MSPSAYSGQNDHRFQLIVNACEAPLLLHAKLLRVLAMSREY